MTTANHSTLRKPGTAINLSMLSPGLGHVYCGVIARGLALQVGALCALILTLLAPLVNSPARVPLVCAGMIAVIALIVYAAVDARRLALRTRADYRLKDYNRPLVYSLFVALSALAAPLVAVFLRGWVVGVFTIAGDACYPSLHAHDRIIADKLAYRGSEPEPGDQIIFLNPDDHRMHWVKRVVGLSGDTVEIRAGMVFVNGKKLVTEVFDDNVEAPDRNESGSIVSESNGSARYRTFRLNSASSGNSILRDMPPLTVPKNHVFVLGDNRDDSLDSRHLGPISLFSIQGKVTMRFWPPWFRSGR